MITRVHTLMKSVFWKLLGVVTLAILTYIYTHQWTLTIAVTGIHHGLLIIVFYIHERLWLRIQYPKNFTIRSIAKAIVYETFLSTILLGTITYLATHNFTQTGYITITYTIIRHIMYILNEFLWNSIQWGNDKNE